jgi:hypothetical protein
MHKLHFLPLLSAALLMTIMTACNKEPEFHQTYVERPADALLLVSGEGCKDSLVFMTTESFTMTTTVTTPGMSNDWYEYPDEFNSFTNNYNSTLVRFCVPVTFKRNDSGKRRTVVFNIAAGDYAASVAFVQDTIIAKPADTTPNDDDTAN